MSKNFDAVVLLALMVLALLAFSPQLIHSAHPMVGVPGPPNPKLAAMATASGCSLPAPQCLSSINWAGYAATGAANSVTFVGASWTVPAIAGAFGTTCPDTVQTWLDASFWVGIDGFNNGYVEQTGISTDCVYGQAAYYPWYQFYPAGSVGLPSADVIYPGDTMYAYVNYTSPPNFGIWLQDKTPRHAWYFSLYGSNAGAPRDSAEWITEAAYGCITPSCSLGNFLALTDFTSVTFTGATATIGTHTYPVSSPAWGTSLYWIDVTTVFSLEGNIPPSPPTLLRAYPTTARFGGFTVKWVNSGP